MCIKKIIFLFSAIFFSFLTVNAGVGCTVNGLTIYKNKNGGGIYWDSGGQMVKIVAPPGCYFPSISPATPCSFTSGAPGGYLATDVLECPIDKGYFVLGFGIIISIVSFKKIKNNVIELTNI